MELNQMAGAAATLATASATVWRLFSDRKASKRSGKRLAFSLHVPPQSLGEAARRMKLFPGLRGWFSREELPRDAEVRSMEAYVFLWNVGAESITSEDFFSKNSLRIHVHDAEVSGASLAFLSHSTVGASTYVPAAASEWEGTLHGRKVGAIELRFEYLPPDHGAVLKIELANVSRRVPLVNVVGPVRGLKPTVFAGTLLSLNMQDEGWLRRIAFRSEAMVNLSLAAMGGVLIGMVLWGGFTHSLGSVRYWGGVLAFVSFEAVYLIFRDVRAQIRYRVPDRLAWWDVKRCERN